jgi:hypothetical protein
MGECDPVHTGDDSFFRYSNNLGLIARNSTLMLLMVLMGVVILLTTLITHDIINPLNL